MGLVGEIEGKRRIGAGIAALFLCTLAALALYPVGTAEADVPSPFWTRCPTGSAGGQCQVPRGVGATPNLPGHLYVADQGNKRVNEFTAWGEFVKTWGWDVVASGPGDDTSAPEDQFEVCVPANGDVCKTGLEGSGVGQFDAGSAQGVAVDGNGDIYVVDRVNSRVQKFDSEGNFLLMFGGGVDQGPTHPGNLCTAQYIVEGDSCGAGTQGNPGPGEGQFGGWPIASFIAIGPSEKVYVGDQERIQIFKSDGTYESQIALPGKGFVSALAVAPSGNIYAGFAASAVGFTPKPDVLKLNPTGTTTLCTIKVAEPTAIALGATESLYVIDDAAAPTKIRQFNSACADEFEPFGEVDFSSGIATGAACNNGLSVYASNILIAGNVESFIRDYGLRPDAEVCPPPIKPPDIDAQYATSVNTDSAVLGARINPHFWPDTTYYVEYGTAKCTQSTCAQKPLEPGTILKGAADADEPLTATGIVLSGLQPGTTYHYRFVSKSSGGGPVYGLDPDGAGPEEASFEKGLEATFTTFSAPSALKTNCSNQGFRGGASAHLTNCRAYEMVSPVNKNDGDIAVLGRFTSPNYPTGLEQSSADGEKLTYSSVTAFGDAVSAPFTSQYIATRKAGQEWSTHGISPPRQAKSVSIIFGLRLDREYKAFSPDLCRAWLVHDSDPILAFGAVEGVINLYGRDNCGAQADSYGALSTSEPQAPEPASSYRMELQGSSNDGAHAFFIASDKLTEDAASGVGFQLYESSGGMLRYVCVLPSGAPSEGTCTVGTMNTNVNDGRENSVDRAISADGSRVYWTSFTGFSGGPGQLYLRVNPDREQSAIDAGICTEPELACTVPVSSGPARFWTGSVDGSIAFFSEAGKLFEFEAGAAAPPQSIATGVVGVAGASKDASRLYFASTKVLSEAKNSSKAQEGQPNLYLYKKQAGEEEGSLTFIATLTGKDLNSPLNPVAEIPVRRASRVSSDGGILAFTSSADLTAYDNTDLQSGEADAEVFLYSAAADRLTCVSCNPTGALPKGRNVEIAGTPQNFWAAASITPWETELYAPQALSENGSRLFFESYEALVPRDTNGVQDVYEWERAASSQECLSEKGAESYVESADGCLSLISSGLSPTDSHFADASPNGRDVFFKTAASLLSQDPGLVDIYDARAEGGLPAPPTPIPPCEGEACQSPPPAPTDPTPSSSVFEGPENEKRPKPCPKGKVRRNGKPGCVAKHKKGQGKKKSKGQGRQKGRAGR